MNPLRRKNNPQFYGYIPEESNRKTLTFVLMFSVHGTIVLGKSFSMALLVQTNWHWLVAFLGCDMGIYLLVKALRRDLYYWPPKMGLFVSVLCHIVGKVFTDFTGAPPTRA